MNKKCVLFSKLSRKKVGPLGKKIGPIGHIGPILTNHCFAALKREIPGLQLLLDERQKALGIRPVYHAMIKAKGKI